MSEKYDIAIIGSGPAGLSAAINAKIRNKNIIIFGNNDLSNKVVKAQKVNNYLGLINVTGVEMKEAFKKHITQHNIEITEERINNIYSMGEYYLLMAGSKSYESKSVILCSGISFGKPFAGEKEFLGRGVGYCATCDGPLYKNKVVTIVGYNKEAMSDADYMTELASKVYYVPMSKDKLILNDKVEVIKDIPISMEGDKFINKIILREKEIETDAIFILRDTVSVDELVPGLKAENGHVVVDNQMKTNLKGCFAAGDLVGKPYQYIKSAGEGQVAAFSAVNYLSEIK